MCVTLTYLQLPTTFHCLVIYAFVLLNSTSACYFCFFGSLASCLCFGKLFLRFVSAPVTLRVEADKGFNFSTTDEAFVCQKKNHFQLSVQLQWSDSLNAIGAEGWLVQMSHASDEQMPGSGTLKPACAFYLDFYGVRAEAPCQRIKVEQSQADRSKRPFLPIRLAWTAESGWSGKCTVGRLHFTETTANNMRKKGKPNPEQRYFYLVVSLCAQLADGQLIPLISHASEKIIVRVSYFDIFN